MKKRDKKNLRFLLGLDSRGLKQWYDQATEDDTDYAMELLAMARDKQQQQRQPQYQCPPPSALQ
jgi:hypothetical protein